MSSAPTYLSTAATPEPDHAADILNDVRSRISADDDHLREARARLTAVLKGAESFPGYLRSFRAGSLAHKTVNTPVSDGDGGIVLDRRSYPTLGPDSVTQAGPEATMVALRDHVMPIVRESYPSAKGRLTRRAIKITFGEPDDEDANDPTVDLVIGLTRKDELGLWIPDKTNATWTASDPEYHTKLLTDPPTDLRRLRAKVIRLAKAAIKHDATPVLSSFNVEALTLEIITELEALPDALATFFDKAASGIKRGRTEDPAGISGPIKLPVGVDLERAAKRLRTLADAAARAVEHTDDLDKVKKQYAVVYPDHVDVPATSTSAIADALRRKDMPGVRRGLGVAPAAALKPTRSYGGPPPRA